MEIVCKQWAESFEVRGYCIEDILTLIQEAYKERAKEGISFATLSYTIDDFLAERTNSDYWFLAFDENNRLCGTARLTLLAGKVGEVCNFAVLPSAQGKHVGTQLLEELVRFGEKMQLDYIRSYTAIHAKSSVKCHCRCGFRIVGINVGLQQSYSSYIFRNQLSPSPFWRRMILTRFNYLLTFLKYKLAKRPDGKNTIIGDFYLRHKNQN